MLHRQQYIALQLQHIDTSKCVVLASGGPLMHIRCIEGDNAICEVLETKEQLMLPIVCLRQLVSIEVTEAETKVVKDEHNGE